MSSEALLENPKMFCEIGDSLFQSNYITAQLHTVQEYIELFTAHNSGQRFCLTVPTKPTYQTYLRASANSVLTQN